MKWTDTLVNLERQILARPELERAPIFAICGELSDLLIKQARPAAEKVKTDADAIAAAHRMQIGQSDADRITELFTQLPPDIASGIDEVMLAVQGAIARVLMRVYTGEKLVADAKAAAPQLMAWVKSA